LNLFGKNKIFEPMDFDETELFIWHRIDACCANRDPEQISYWLSQLVIHKYNLDDQEIEIT